MAQFSETTMEIGISFVVAKRKDYGTITIPEGTQVYRNINEDGSISPWHVSYPCHVPDNGNMMVNEDGIPGMIFMNDVMHYGLTVPAANVLNGSKPFHHGHCNKYIT